MNEKRTLRPVSLQGVRRLTIDEIAELWSREIDVPASVIRRDLRYAILNFSRWFKGEPLITENLPEDQLPRSDTFITREEIIEFCAKQGNWHFPRFWFDQETAKREYPGRPSIKRAIEKKLIERHANGQLRDRLSEEARELHQWAATDPEFAGLEIPGLASLRNSIRVKYNELKSKR